MIDIGAENWYYIMLKNIICFTGKREAYSMKNVIHIYGASGSGTSTLGLALCRKAGFRFLDTDDYYWLPTDPKFTTAREQAERLSLMKRDIESAENAVISGSLVDWGDELIPYFTLAVRVVTPTPVRMDRLQKREAEEFGDRILPGGDMFEQSREFMKYARLYDDGDETIRSKKMHDLWEKKLSCRRILVDGTLPVEELLAIVESNL